MGFVFDADLLSTFAKIERLELLAKVFGNKNLLMPPAVASDLQRSKSILVKNVLKSKLFQQTNLSSQERELVKKISERKHLGMGEIECIAVCKQRKMVIVTNDNKAIDLADKLGIEAVDLEAILYSMKELMEIKALKQIIEDIEAKDRVVIVNKEIILRNSE
ncbi:hypothetical protein HY637_00090 [Candidatus Woesearchaeota archaeon]|nr:hypothetical protein [Candidatus Woesearchaeota archaeon]